jgi:hypothetical protein
VEEYETPSMGIEYSRVRQISFIGAVIAEIR